MTDKASMFDFLSKKGIDVGKWKTVNSVRDLEKEIKYFKKNKVQVIIKPRKGSGSRGVLIIDENKKFFSDLLEDKSRFCGIGSWQAIKTEIKKRKTNLKNNLIMPYHNNDTYDVDCLAKNGQLINDNPAEISLMDTRDLNPKLKLFLDKYYQKNYKDINLGQI